MTNYVLHENDINQFYFYCILFWWKWKQFMIGPIVQRFIISIFAVTMRRELFSPLKRLRFVTSKIDVGFVCAKIALKSKPEALLQLGDVKLGYSFKMRAKPDNIGRCLAVPKARRTSAVNSLPPSLCLQKLVPQID